MQKTRFSQKLSNLELWCLLTTYTKLCNWAFQRTYYWIPKIQDGWDPPSWKSTWRLFFCRGWSDLDKISETGAEWHVDCGDVAEIETRCRIPIWWTFGRIQWHVIPEPRITLQGAATWWCHCHDSRATCHIAGCKNSIRHIENRFSPYFFLFLMQFRLWRAAALVSSPIHLLCITSSIKRLHLCRKLLQFEVDIITINRYHSQKISWENTEYARANASFIHKIFKTTVVVCFY